MSDQMPRPRALVTGASSGIGLAFAQRLSNDGYDLILVARRHERLTQLARKLENEGTTAEVVVADLATPKGLAIAEQRAATGDVSMLVNNAGFQTYMPFVELDPDLAEAQIRVQVTAILRLSRAVLPAMLARNAGAIVNVSSMLAYSGHGSAFPAQACHVRRHKGLREFLHRDLVERTRRYWRQSSGALPCGSAHGVP